VIDSRDISYAFTNLIANDYYSFSTYLLNRSLNAMAKRADNQKTMILSAYSVISIHQRKEKMISLSGSSSLSKVSIVVIQGSDPRADDLGWKRLLLADGPRQSINALVLYSFAYSFGFQTHDIPAYWDRSPITAMLLFAQLATVLIFAGSLILLVAAALLYVPLLCYIQGNLKVDIIFPGVGRS
jgi:hypothetical protein